MVIVALLLGTIIGGALSGISGALAGMLFGYALWSIFSSRNRLSALEHEVQELRGLVESSSRISPLSSPPPAENSATFPGKPVADASPPLEKTDAPDNADIPEWTPDWSEIPATAQPALLRDPELQPSALRSILNPILNFLAGGSLLVKTGVVILFVGVSFLVKYAADHALLPIELRLSGAADRKSVV